MVHYVFVCFCFRSPAKDTTDLLDLGVVKQHVSARTVVNQEHGFECCSALTLLKLTLPDGKKHAVEKTVYRSS